jgi:CheY-like chemotaxis protein
MLKFVIEGSGYKVVAARDAGEALERMQQSGCDLVLVNYRNAQNDWIRSDTGH